MKNAINSKKLIFSIILLGTIALLLSYYQTILIGAGRFLAPEGASEADVVIIEGTELVREKALTRGIDLLSSGMAKKLVVVHQNAQNGKSYIKPHDYDLMITGRLERFGIRKDRVLVLEVPADHPITLTEAKIVIPFLSQNGIKSAILLTEGFHTRRSFWVYQQVGCSYGIKIIPHPYFLYPQKSWWQEIEGVRDFFAEFLKYFYYLLRGYVPLKSLVMT